MPNLKRLFSFELAKEEKPTQSFSLRKQTSFFAAGPRGVAGYKNLRYSARNNAKTDRTDNILTAINLNYLKDVFLHCAAQDAKLLMERDVYTVR